MTSTHRNGSRLSFTSRKKAPCGAIHQSSIVLASIGERDALLNLTSQPTYNQGGGPNFEGVVPPGMVLAMGDNRGNSNDGRKFGFIDERELFGRAVAIYYRRGDGFTWKPL